MAEGQLIRAAIKRNPFTNAVAIQQNLRLDVNAITVRRRLHEKSIHYRTPAVKEKLTEGH